MNFKPASMVPIRCFTILYICLFAATPTYPAPPHIFYSDLESGPNTGGENNAGAWVSIYGKNFGETQGKSFVTICGAPAASYRIWTNTNIAFQLGSAARTGDIVVTSAQGSSNGIRFTVRPGNIRFVANSGSDWHKGTFTSPWRTLRKARDAMRAGDITYAMDGVRQTTDDGEGWNAALTLRGQCCNSSGYPKAIITYPGATVTVGSIDGPDSGIRSAPSGPVNPDAWVFAGLVVRGRGAAFALWGGSHWRLVANDISCPNGDGPAACIATSFLSASQFLGNNIHDTGKAGPPTASTLYHGVYLGTDSNHIDFGWNTIANVHGGRGLQVHSTPQDSQSGYNQHDIAIHDNVIHNTQCDGIVLATVDPSKGPVQIFNNVVYNAGEGPDNPERNGNWACIYVAGYTNRGSLGGGIVDVYNNTMYDCGSFSHVSYGNSRGAIINGEHNPNLTVRLRNNIIYQTSTAPYLVNFGVTNGIVGTNNLFFGNAPPVTVSAVTHSITTDPLFVSPAQGDFHLEEHSPARGKGVAITLIFDRDGIKHDNASGWDIGAF